MGQIYVRAARQSLRKAKNVNISAQIAVAYIEEAKQYFNLAAETSPKEHMPEMFEEDLVFDRVCAYFKHLEKV